MSTSAIHAWYVDELTEDAVREIERIHSNWIEFEVAGKDHSLMALCADDIELWPPNAQPVLGRAAVSAKMAHVATRIHGIEITDRRIRGSNEVAYLTANYKTTFSSAGRLQPYTSPRKPSVDTAKASRHVGCHPSELVIVGHATWAMPPFQGLISRMR
jgi:ketosteroid isomerase-like protein